MPEEPRTHQAAYQAYGLTFSSPLPLRGFALTDRPANVHISTGRAPASLEGARRLGAFWSATADEVLIRLPAVVAHHITRSGTLTIDRAPAYSEPDEQLYGVPMAASLAFAGLTVLHGAGVILPGRPEAVLVVGQNGAGKSSLVAALASDGADPVCDNLAAIDPTGARVLLRPGPSTVRLWADAAARLGIDITDAPPVSQGTPKYLISRPMAAEPVPLGGIVVLIPADVSRPELVALTGRDAVVAVLDNHFRRSLMSVIAPAMMASAVTLAAAVPVWRLTRPRVGSDPLSLATFFASRF